MAGKQSRPQWGKFFMAITGNNHRGPPLFNEEQPVGGDTVSGSPKFFAGFCAALLVFTFLAAIAVFFIRVRGAEEVMVPDVQHKEILSALIELQNKELYPRLQLRFSKSAAEKGLILEQDPKPGAIVKAGRRIRLVVSQGVLVSTTGNYVGRNIDDVRSELATLFSSSDMPLISIREPLLYQFSPETPGTILEQNPPAGTGISGPTEVSLVVSRGMEAENLEMPILMGLNLDAAIVLIVKSGIRYEFLLRTANSAGAVGSVVAQNPAGGDAIPSDRIAQITIGAPREPDLTEGEAADLFKRRLPENPYPLQTVLEAVLPTGERQTLATVSFKGGNFTYPYRLPKGSILVLSVLNREIYRETVE
jgi:beta-lactam-binding protein with PASTA domain